MTINKRKKNSRQRAKTTHGWGAKKKHRGAGNRGGRGMAGSGKRADQLKPSILKWYGNQYFGKRGFRTHTSKKVKAININKLEKLDLKKEGDFYIFDASKDYNKILGTGKITKKYRVTCSSFSKKAEDKIKKLGGEAIKCS